jgi:hypothetical protein
MILENIIGGALILAIIGYVGYKKFYKKKK